MRQVARMDGDQLQAASVALTRWTGTEMAACLQHGTLCRHI